MANESCTDLREHLRAPAGYGSEEARSQVTCRVDGIAGVKTHGEADDQDDEAHGEGLQALGDGVIVRVHDGQDAYNQSCCANGLQGGMQQSNQTLKLIFVLAITYCV